MTSTPCWTVVRSDGTPADTDQPTPHHPDRDAALEALADRLVDVDPDTFPDGALAWRLQQLPSRCVVVHCIGCERSLEDLDEGYLVHFATPAEAHAYAVDVGWRLEHAGTATCADCRLLEQELGDDTWQPGPGPGQLTFDGHEVMA